MNIMTSNLNCSRVHFAPSCQVLVVLDKTKGIEDRLWYSGEDVENFKLHSTLHAEEVKRSISDGTFRGDLEDILGLEKHLFKESYHRQRAILKRAVFEEQAWQRLSKELRRRRGLGDVDGHIAHDNIIRLATIAEKYSRWAKERASVAALVLEKESRQQHCSPKVTATNDVAA